MSYVTVTAVIAPAPHLLRKGVRPERTTTTCGVEDIATAVGELTQAAERLGVFGGGGCLSVLIQHAPEAG